MTKQTNVDELLIEEIRKITYKRYGEISKYGDLTQDGAKEILTLVRQHDKSQRNDVIEEVKVAVKKELNILQEDDLLIEVLENAIEALKNKDD